MTLARAGPGITMRRVDPRTDPLWYGLVAGPGGSLFVAPPWLAALADTYDIVPEGMIAVDGSGRAQAGVSWTDVRDLRGQRRVVLPFSDRADPVVLEDGCWPAVADDLLAGDLPVTMRCLPSSIAASTPRLSPVAEAAWHVTHLDRPLEAVQQALRPATRRNIATAMRSGVEVQLRTDADAVAEYHRLHVHLRRHKYRLLAQPLAFFERIWARFAPDDGIRTALALVEGRPVAGAIYLVWQDTVYYKFGASQVEFLPLRPNDAVHWELIRWASGRGLTALDWGLSDLDQPGLVAYKRGWASTEGRIVTLNAGGPPRDRRAEVDRLLSELTELLTDPAVPDSVTARAGATLYRYFC